MSPKHERRDPDQPDARDPETGYPNLLSTSERRGNGKRWWQEVWGKVTAGLLILTIPAAAAWVYFKAVAAYSATVELYTLPPIVAQHSAELKALRAKPPMTDQQIQDLAEAIAARLPQARKGKP